MLTIGVLGCGLLRTVPDPTTPEATGMVVSTESVQENLTRFNLENGQTFTVNELDGKALISVYAAGPAVGDLLLGGSDCGHPWLALVAPGTLTRSDLPVGYFALDG